MEINKKGQPISATIYRYITSKGHRKDKQGVLELTDAEVSEIETGMTSCIKLSSINKRLHQIFFEFKSCNLMRLHILRLLPCLMIWEYYIRN